MANCQTRLSDNQQMLVVNHPKRFLSECSDSVKRENTHWLLRNMMIC